MIKVEVIESFTLGDFEKLKNIVRNDPKKNEKGKLYINDVFECDKKMADYLTGNNHFKRAFVKIIEIIPEKKEKKETLQENDVQKTKTKRKRKKLL